MCFLFIKGDYGRGYAVAYFPIGSNDNSLRELLLHEAGGHGFAKLEDEYFYESYGTIPDDQKNTKLRFRDNFGWGKNIDYTSSSDRVIWSKFISDARYAVENIGVYEGAATYIRGVYRPTDYSIMRYNEGGFNAPSREAIYYRIHKLAYFESWQYDYEDFVQWDQEHVLSNLLTKAGMSIPADFKPTAPPVVRSARWEDGGLIEE